MGFPMKNEVHRKTFPRVREVVKNGVTRYVCDSRRQGFGGGRQEWFSSRDEALDRAREISDSLVKGTTLTDEERSLFLYFRDAFTPHQVTVKSVLEKALYRLQNKSEKDEDERKTISDLVDMWIAYKKEGKFKRIRPVTLTEIEHTGKTIKSLWGELQYQSVTKEHAEKFIGGHKGSYATKRNWKVKIGGFFNWCNDEGWGRGNPAKNIPIFVDPTDAPKTVPLETVRKMLEVAQKTPRFLPLINYLAIGYFAGLRPYEMRRLPKGDIKIKKEFADGDGGQIYISRNITKTKTERYVTINEALFAFLKAYPEQPIYHKNFVKLFTALRETVGYGFPDGRSEENKWVPDAIRHTFGSMWQAKHKNINMLAEEMGNSPEVIRRHYKRAIPAEEVGPYWAIRPIPKG